MKMSGHPVCVTLAHPGEPFAMKKHGRKSKASETWPHGRVQGVADTPSVCKLCEVSNNLLCELALSHATWEAPVIENQ